MAAEIADYEAAGCRLAIVEARAGSRDDAKSEIGRLTAGCAPLAARPLPVS